MRVQQQQFVKHIHGLACGTHYAAKACRSTLIKSILLYECVCTRVWGAGEKFSHDIEAGVLFFSQLQVCAVFKSGHCSTPVC